MWIEYIYRLTNQETEMQTISRQQRRALEREAAKTAKRYPNIDKQTGHTFGMDPAIKPKFADAAHQVGACHVNITGETDFVDLLITNEQAAKVPTLSQAELLVLVQRIGYLLDGDRCDDKAVRAEVEQLAATYVVNTPTYKQRTIVGTTTSMMLLSFKCNDDTYGMISGAVAPGKMDMMTKASLTMGSVGLLADVKELHKASVFRFLLAQAGYTPNEVGGHTRMQNGKQVHVRPYKRG